MPLDRTTTQIILTRTTLAVSVGATREIWAIAYKPARVKMAVKMMCCLIDIRRRHSNGIGWYLLDCDPPEESCWRAHQGEHYRIETDVH